MSVYLQKFLDFINSIGFIYERKGVRSRSVLIDEDRSSDFARNPWILSSPTTDLYQVGV
jgi:hypothetical protein